MNKSVISLILILILAAVGVFTVIYLSENDYVENAADVDRLILARGRIVHLLGVESCCVVEKKDCCDITNVTHDNTDENGIEIVDTEEVKKLRDLVNGKWALLDFAKFEPDTASPDLHAYVIINKGSDPLDVGAWVLENGLGRVDSEHKHPKLEEYKQLEAKAKAAGIGVWAVKEDSTATTEEES